MYFYYDKKIKQKGKELFIVLFLYIFCNMEFLFWIGMPNITQVFYLYDQYL